MSPTASIASPAFLPTYAPPPTAAVVPGFLIATLPAPLATVPAPCAPLVRTFAPNCISFGAAILAAVINAGTANAGRNSSVRSSPN